MIWVDELMESRVPFPTRPVSDSAPREGGETTERCLQDGEKTWISMLHRCT